MNLNNEKIIFNKIFNNGELNNQEKSEKIISLIIDRFERFGIKKIWL